MDKPNYVLFKVTTTRHGEIMKIITDDKAHIKFSSCVYDKEAILAAAYKFTDSFYVEVNSYNDHELEVVIQPKSSEKLVDISTIAAEFCNEALDHQYRFSLSKRFGGLRELIVKQAFSPLKNLNAQIKDATNK